MSGIIWTSSFADVLLLGDENSEMNAYSMSISCSLNLRVYFFKSKLQSAPSLPGGFLFVLQS